MSQTYTTDCFGPSHVAQTDLQDFENNFAALKSMFSGASAPSNTLAGMHWFDTTKKVQKVRNTGDSAWIGLMHGDTSQKIWVYRNAAMDGWAIDSSVTDKVLALKGGSTYVTGGASAGSWSISGFASHLHSQTAHVHVWYNFNPATGTNDQSYDSAGALKNLASTHAKESSICGIHATGDYTIQSISDDFHTSNPTAAVNTGSTALSHDATWRPAAAVGTLQYLDL